MTEYEKPKGMDDCIYFTNRKNDFGKQLAWVMRADCPKCKKGKMGKPFKKNGKRKMRTKEYECGNCGYETTIDEFEDIFKLTIQYECAACGNKDMAQIPYKRSSYKGVKAFKFNCSDCGLEIPIAKKMKKVDKKVKAKKKLGDD